MSLPDQQPNLFETSGTSPPQGAAPEQNIPMTAEERKAHRTLGLRLFDLMLYPLINNFMVFGMSVAATYFTSKGDVHGGKIGKAFFTRGQWLENKLQTLLHMKPESASFAKMVAFSFGDGIVLTPVVKIAEDHREHIGKAIDDNLGTTPSNLAIYDSEPKQTWGSVLKGRIATGMIVLPTAVVFDKTGVNNRLFTGVGHKIGNYIESKPRLAAKFGKADVHEVSKIGVFEFVYTSICTAGLYFSSRMFARKHDQQTGRTERDPVTRRVTVHAPAQNDNDLTMASNDNPPTHMISEVSQSRLMDGAPVLAATR